jgi:predicted nucleotidyltransferase component of viral defense system
MKLFNRKLLEMNHIKKLHIDVLPPETLKIFNVIQNHNPLINQLKLDERLCLVGGTALALQIGHRRSNDLDFACFDAQLPNYAIDQFLSVLRENHQIRQVNSIAQISKFKIQTGLNLLDYVRDYTIDDVKITFFILGSTVQQKDFYKLTPKLQKMWSFPLLGLEGVRVAKALVLRNRVRSRDMYDLMILIKDYGYSFESFLMDLRNFSINDDLEYHKAILIGKIPLDRDDEGLLGVDVEIGISQIYDFFKTKFKDYEIKITKQLLN